MAWRGIANGSREIRVAVGQGWSIASTAVFACPSVLSVDIFTSRGNECVQCVDQMKALTLGHLERITITDVVLVVGTMKARSLPNGG